MFFSWLKRSMPRSLYGRAALILLLPVLTIQTVVAVVFIQRLYADVTEQMTRNVLVEMRHLVEEIDAAPDRPAAEARVAPLLDPLDLDLRWDPAVPPADTRRWYDLSGRVVIPVLREGLPRVEAVDLASSDRTVTAFVDTANGQVSITFARRRVSASNPHQLLVLMTFTSVLMTLVAFLFLRNQVRPIARLARAAQAFGRGRVEPYKPQGATEVRAAGSAFLDMRNRIERQIEQRTMMLSGVSHDLRTPITRLKLELSMMEESPEVLGMRRDVEDMERLLDAFLAFARGEAMDALEDVEPADVVASVVSKARRAGQAVTTGRVDRAGTVRLHPLAIERALDNLVGNAVRYGTRAELSLAAGEKSVRFTVEDDGPGIPPEARGQALKPFSRLDSARNQDRGAGVGLGLAIAHDIARRHGGTLRLDRSDRLGGLRADIVLPL